MARNFVIGSKELEGLLKKMPEKVAEKVTLGALRSGAAIIARQARQNVKSSPAVDSGLLVKNISTRTRKSRSDRKSAPKVVSVGIKGATAQVIRKGRHKATKASPRRYAHFVEFGTENMPAEPFMRPALDQQGANAINKIMEAIGRGIEREARKLAGK